MKKRILIVFLTLALCLGSTLTALAEEYFVYDDANLLSDAEETQLSTMLSELSQTYGAQLVVATVTSSNTDMDQYAEFVYDEMNFGYGENRDGVLLLVCMEPREYRIVSNGFAGSAIENSEISAIGNAISSDLSAGYYSDAFDTFADECAYYLDGHINGFPFRFGRNLLISLVIGLAVGLIVAFKLKGQLKTVRKQNQADVYVKPGSMQITLSNDMFLYRNVTRTKKQSNSSSSSGSSRSVGGGSF